MQCMKMFKEKDNCILCCNMLPSGDNSIQAICYKVVSTTKKQQLKFFTFQKTKVSLFKYTVVWCTINLYKKRNKANPNLFLVL